MSVDRILDISEEAEVTDSARHCGSANGSFSARDFGDQAGLENRLDPLFIEAPLAHIVWRCRRDFNRFVLPYDGSVISIYKQPIPEIDKRVLALFSQGFLQFSQFLCAFDCLFVDAKYRNLSLQDFIGELGKIRRQFIVENPGAFFDRFCEFYDAVDSADSDPD